MKCLPLAALALVCAFAGCKKDDEATPTKTELLTAKSWRLSGAAVTFTSNTGTITIDVYGGINPNTRQPYTPACAKDDFRKFSTDKTLMLNQGTAKCSPADLQIKTIAWDFTSNESKLLFSATPTSTLSDVYDVVELTATTLKTRQSETDQGETVTYVETYTAF